MSSFASKVILITGIGQNIGKAVATRLAAAGAILVISDLRSEVLDAAAAALDAGQVGPSSKESWSGGAAGSPRVTALAGDIRQQEECTRIVESVIQTYGRIDALVNCAGRSSFGHSLQMSADLFAQEIDTNVKGTFLIARTAAKAMVEQGSGGRIVLFSSSDGESARPGGISHSSSKAAVNMITRVLALELGAHGITVNAIAPGLVPAPTQTLSEEYREAVRRSVPLGRLGRPDDLAGAVEFLLSDDASWLTGEILTIDGGAHAGRGHLPLGLDRPRAAF